MPKTSPPLPLAECLHDATEAAKFSSQTIYLMYDVSCNRWTWEAADGDTLSDPPILCVNPDGSAHPEDMNPLDEVSE